MIKEQKAQISTELILILAAILIIVLTSSVYINNTLNNITIHIQNVTENIRESMLGRL